VVVFLRTATGGPEGTTAAALGKAEARKGASIWTGVSAGGGAWIGATIAGANASTAFAPDAIASASGSFPLSSIALSPSADPSSVAMDSAASGSRGKDSTVGRLRGAIGIVLIGAAGDFVVPVDCAIALTGLSIETVIGPTGVVSIVGVVGSFGAAGTVEGKGAVGAVGAGMAVTAASKATNGSDACAVALVAADSVGIPANRAASGEVAMGSAISAIGCFLACAAPNVGRHALFDEAL